MKLFPKLTRTLEWIVPGYEGSYTVYQIMEDGHVWAYGFSATKEQSHPSLVDHGSYEKAVYAVERLVANRLKDDTSFGPCCKELEPIYYD